ncbi:WXG100 family type VII secretion target [Actinomadura sp. NBRC 104425]|uniref:WXG100 family type VII secretion target n=1 Tax=Actinomadura sp. NBRC 104425 TaxID=3032204 RepID=UPI002554795D|nr:WXG100 family type VII secretion target [Actinomadura sp. NBRC 104425]
MTYKVTPEYLANAATDTQNAATQISQELAQIKTYVVSLEEVWGGIAHDRFVALMAEYDILAQMLNTALTGIASGLRGNYINYKESEQQNVTNLANIEAGMPGGPGAVANLT